jgi:hypothetical protein
MGMFDNLEHLLKQATGGNAQDSDVHSAFDQVAKAVPQGALADGLAQAFKSDQTPPFEQMLSGLFANSSPDQKAGILNQLMGALGPQGLSQLQALTGVNATTVTPQQAQQVTPQALQAAAQEAVRKDPTIMDTAASFYAQHPTLVKGIGAAALALVMSRVAAGHRA